VIQDAEKLPPWRLRLHEIIFEADTPAGRAFDIGEHAGVPAVRGGGARRRREVLQVLRRGPVT
jgi:hypothetical protein